MYCRNYTGTVSHVLCREVYYTVSFLGSVHYQRFHCIMKTVQYLLREYLHAYVCRIVYVASLNGLTLCLRVCWHIVSY